MESGAVILCCHDVAPDLPDGFVDITDLAEDFIEH
jgi:hypothetical protein